MGLCPERVLSGGDYVQRGFVRGVLSIGGYVLRGFDQGVMSEGVCLEGVMPSYPLGFYAVL